MWRRGSIRHSHLFVITITSEQHLRGADTTLHSTSREMASGQCWPITRHNSGRLRNDVKSRLKFKTVRVRRTEAGLRQTGILKIERTYAHHRRRSLVFHNADHAQLGSRVRGENVITIASPDRSVRAIIRRMHSTETGENVPNSVNEKNT